ncbi:hypothetical protein ACQR1N_12355 [Bradyrhizobium sp. HKCCYLRH1073]|uniref:hypothetical protein n=1 Tax=unclassified Bradyrhizobium TaxID=2631580 RepID=UPI003EB7D194
MTDHLVVGLSAWIIQDANYPDFAQGSRTAFALEFWAQTPLEGIELPAAMRPWHAHQGSAIYAVTGRVVHVDNDW